MPSIGAEPAPAPGAAGGKAEVTLAIVGLNPAAVTGAPRPPESRAAGFSAGPEKRLEGGTGANGTALVNVPGLVVKGGAKDAQPTLVAAFSPTSRENLLAAARMVTPAGPAGRPPARFARTEAVGGAGPQAGGRVPCIPSRFRCPM